MKKTIALICLFGLSTLTNTSAIAKPRNVKGSAKTNNNVKQATSQKQPSKRTATNTNSKASSKANSKASSKASSKPKSKADEKSLKLELKEWGKKEKRSESFAT